MRILILVRIKLAEIKRRVLKKLGLMTIREHEQELVRENQQAMKMAAEFMESSDDKLIEENERMAAVLESYKAGEHRAEKETERYREELFQLMCMCWEMENPELTAYCDKLETKYFDGFYYFDDEDGG